MTKINWKIRFKNPIFIAQIIMAILLPIVAYFGLNVEDLTSWGKLGNILLSAISNPYVVGLVIVSLWNAINDPTTTGITDSTNALNYEKPNNN